MELSDKNFSINKCFVCGSKSLKKPKIYRSEITSVPEGLDRSLNVKSYVYKCNNCKSFSCMPIQNHKNYDSALCFDASKKTLENANNFYPYSSNLIPLSIRRKIQSHVFVDFGCGAGFFTREIKPHVRKVIGVDLDPSGISLLQGDNITAYLGGTEILKKLKFDSISLVGVLEHFKNPEGFLEEVDNMLPNKNSAFLIYYPNPYSLSSILSLLSNNAWDMFLEPGHYSFPSKNYLIKKMSSFRFKCKSYWTSSNISRGKNPFGLNRVPAHEKFIRRINKRYSFIKAIYILLFKVIDFFRLGDIHCFFFYR